MIALHLLNVAGGYWIFYTLQKRSKQQLSERLDIDHYAGSQTITIKLPLSHFEGSDRSNYERVDGEFEYEGITYRLVKQKFYQDTAYIVCYKDEETIAIKDALENYVDSFSDTPNGKKSDNKTAFLFIKDFLHHHHTPSLKAPGGLDILRGTMYQHHDQPRFDFVIDHPPEPRG
jgi:hypothetical protein